MTKKEQTSEPFDALIKSLEKVNDDATFRQFCDLLIEELYEYIGSEGMKQVYKLKVEGIKRKKILIDLLEQWKVSPPDLGIEEIDQELFSDVLKAIADFKKQASTKSTELQELVDDKEPTANKDILSPNERIGVEELGLKEEQGMIEERLRKERESTLRKILTRYEEISLELMGEFLQFENTKELQRWIMDLPEEITLYVKKEIVIIPQELRSGTTEAEEAIEKLLKSFEEFEKKGKGKI